jgi:release factor glutamine methyltransferase
MKVASNKLSDLYAFYKSELATIYEQDELMSIFELVCEKYLKYSKAEVKQHFTENINQSDLLKIYDTCLELKAGTPIQYILKEAYFYDSFFEVTPFVLIPRPETEELVDSVIKLNHSTFNIQQSTILDIGTGSGCIPITLKKHFPNAIVVGIDVSEQALEVAKRNAIKHLVEVEFIKLDILSAFNSSLITHRSSLIISNPPYVLKSEAEQMEKRVLSHEPHLALFVEDHDPIIFYKRIIDLCDIHLEKNGLLFFELNPLYAHAVNDYAIASNLFIFSEILLDMSGKQRFLKAQKK